MTAQEPILRERNRIYRMEWMHHPIQLCLRCLARRIGQHEAAAINDSSWPAPAGSDTAQHHCNDCQQHREHLHIIKTHDDYNRRRGAQHNTPMRHNPFRPRQPYRWT